MVERAPAIIERASACLVERVHTLREIVTPNAQEIVTLVVERGALPWKWDVGSGCVNTVLALEASIVLFYAAPYNFAAKDAGIRWVASSRVVRWASGLMPTVALLLAVLLWQDVRRLRRGAASQGPVHTQETAAVLATALSLTARAHRTSFSLLLLIFVSRAYYLARDNASALLELEQSAIERDMLQFTPSQATLALLSNTYASAFRPALLGLENIPARRPLLFVGNHPVLALDAPVLIAELYKKTGIYLRMLADHAHFQIPVNASVIRNVVGAVDGTRRNCSKLFDSGACVFVYPGGVSHRARAPPSRSSARAPGPARPLTLPSPRPSAHAPTTHPPTHRAARAEVRDEHAHGEEAQRQVAPRKEAEEGRLSATPRLHMMALHIQ